MRSLYFCPHQILPQNSGGRLRDFQLARQLATNESVTFAEMRSAGEPHQALPEDPGFVAIVTLCKDRPYSASKIVKGLVGPVPLTILNCWSPRSAIPIGGGAAIPPV